MRALALALLLALLLTTRLYAPPLSAAARWRAAHVASPWAHRYRIPFDLARKIVHWADHNHLERSIAFRLVKRESGFHPDLRGGAGEVGLTQVKPSTARDLRPGITIPQLFVPDTNLDVGFEYLRRLRVRYHGNIARAAVAYNLGMAVADTLQGTTPYALILLGRSQ